MAAVAAEMNLSETAFAQAGDDGDWNLRWFTPTVEVDLELDFPALVNEAVEPPTAWPRRSASHPLRRHGTSTTFSPRRARAAARSA